MRFPDNCIASINTEALKPFKFSNKSSEQVFFVIRNVEGEGMTCLDIFRNLKSSGEGRA